MRLRGHRESTALPDKSKREFPNTGKSYYDTEGTSYAFNFFLGGRKMYEFVRQDRVREYFKGNVAEEEIWVMRDYIGFHGEAGKPGAANYLYIDGRVGDLAR